MPTRFLCTALGLAVVLFLSGCGGGPDKHVKNRPKTVPASGKVLFNGTPVEGAMVVFAPKAGGEKGVAAMAMTDSAGKFHLMAYPPKKGAVPGSYEVTISKTDAPPPSSPESHDGPPPPKPKYFIPQKYTDVKTSGLIAEIPAEGRNDLDFDLK